MKSLTPIILVLVLALSGCSQSPSSEELIRTLPLVPQATTPRQLGSMLEYSTSGDCLNAELFYETEMRMSGWAKTSSDGAGTSWSRLKFERERDTVEINLSSSPVSPSTCSIQIFYHKYSSLDTGIPQRVIGIVVILVFQALFAFAGGLAAKGKGRHPAIGWALGFFLGFLGDFFILTWEPRRDLTGRMIGWDEYKRMSKEQREIVIAKPAPPSPQMKQRRLLSIILLILVLIVFVFMILKNIGQI